MHIFEQQSFFFQGKAIPLQADYYQNVLSV